eukprot:TRINITY_DN6237_c0_g4_i2.p1 TRINITY_DN6237_c0_g4~~TRINITY_DN6237_c0_g4_i2.p1  ORF type:complete len:113 (+),score=5.19 TRINITY_DN6237_c0_g4_i2:121-459(+)
MMFIDVWALEHGTFTPRSFFHVPLLHPTAVLSSTRQPVGAWVCSQCCFDHCLTCPFGLLLPDPPPEGSVSRASAPPLSAALAAPTLHALTACPLCGLPPSSLDMERPSASPV